MGSFTGPHYSFPSFRSAFLTLGSPISPSVPPSYPPLRLPCHGSGEKWPLRAGIPGLVAIFYHFRSLLGGAGDAGAGRGWSWGWPKPELWHEAGGSKAEMG